MIQVTAIENHPSDQQQFVAHGVVDGKQVTAHGWRSRLGHGDDTQYLQTILREHALAELPDISAPIIELSQANPVYQWIKANWITVGVSVLMSGLWHFVK